MAENEVLADQIRSSLPNWQDDEARAALEAVLAAMDGDPGPLRAAGRTWNAVKLKWIPAERIHRHGVGHTVIHECDECSFVNED